MKRLTRSQRRGLVRALDRRRARLHERLADYQGNPSRTRQELAAITWALQLIRAAEQESVLRDLEQVVVAGDPFDA